MHVWGEQLIFSEPGSGRGDWNKSQGLLGLEMGSKASKGVTFSYSDRENFVVTKLSPLLPSES